MKTSLFTFLILLTFWSNAYAYLDPVSGGIILQLLIAGITVCIAYIVFYYKKFKDFLKNIFRRKKNKRN